MNSSFELPSSQILWALSKTSNMKVLEKCLLYVFSIDQILGAVQKFIEKTSPKFIQQLALNEFRSFNLGFHVLNPIYPKPLRYEQNFQHESFRTEFPLSFLY